jgi:hypothetical protein
MTMVSVMSSMKVTPRGPGTWRADCPEDGDRVLRMGLCSAGTDHTSRKVWRLARQVVGPPPTPVVASETEASEPIQRAIL